VITAKLEEALHGWSPGEPLEHKYPDPPPPQACSFYVVDKPTAAQSVVAVGHVGVRRDYFTMYQSMIEAVTTEDVARVARKYIDFEHLTILVVGDRKVIEPKLKEMPSTEVVHVLDPDGNPQTKVTVQ
jgi:hypothetical protein